MHSPDEFHASASPLSESGKEAIPKELVLVVTYNGKPDAQVEETLNQLWGIDETRNVRFMAPNELPQMPPENLRRIVLNCNPTQDTDLSQYANIGFTRLGWNRDGSFWRTTSAVGKLPEV